MNYDLFWFQILFRLFNYAYVVVSDGHRTEVTSPVYAMCGRHDPVTVQNDSSTSSPVPSSVRKWAVEPKESDGERILEHWFDLLSLAYPAIKTYLVLFIVF